MSYGKAVPVFARAGLDVNLRNVSALSTRRLESTVASTRRNQSAEERAYIDCAVPKTDVQADLIQQNRNHVPNKNKISIDFEQTKEAYKSKDTGELLRSLIVFKLCSYDLLVDKNKEVGVCFGVLCVLKCTLQKANHIYFRKMYLVTS